MGAEGWREDSGSVGPLNDARNFETDEMIVHDTTAVFRSTPR